MPDDSLPLINTSKIGRRKAIKALGAGATAGLFAGCAGEGDPGSGSDGADGGSGDGADGDGGGFPERDIQLVIPFGPGGGFDTYARLVAEFASREISTNFAPTNVEGAGGVVGTEQVYSSEPDGYTIMIASLLSKVLEQIKGGVNFDLYEMTTLPQVAANPSYIWTAGNHTGIESWDDYVAAAQDEELRYGTRSVGGSGDRVPIITGALTGLWDPAHVAENRVVFDSMGDQVSAILSQDVDTSVTTTSSIQEWVESGDVRAFAIWGEPLSSVDVDYEIDQFEEHVDDPDVAIDMNTTRRTFMGPPDIPENRAEILRDALGSAIQSDEFLQAAEEAGRPIAYLNSEDAAAAIDNMFTGFEEHPEILDYIFE